MGVTECMAAVEAIRSLCDVPILCTLSVYSDGKCYFDGSAEEAAEVLPGLGADAVGLNCSSGPDQMGTVVRMMKKAAPDTPIAAKPNAGLPTITETGEAVYHMNPRTSRGTCTRSRRTAQTFSAAAAARGLRISKRSARCAEPYPPSFSRR